MNYWMQLHNGAYYDLETGTISANWSIRDCAIQLSRINRFLGASRKPINVASHSLGVMIGIANSGGSRTQQLHGLMHDAHEALIGDIITPLKRMILQETNRFAGIDAVAEAAIYGHFHLPNMTKEDAAIVHEHDMKMLMTEKRDLMNSISQKWNVDPKYTPYEWMCHVIEPEWAVDQFVSSYQELRKAIEFEYLQTKIKNQVH